MNSHVIVSLLRPGNVWMSHLPGTQNYKHGAERIIRLKCSKANLLRDSTQTAHLFQIEDVMVEVILQLLICIVDAELLEAVSLKILKPKNVKDTNG